MQLQCHTSVLLRVAVCCRNSGYTSIFIGIPLPHSCGKADISVLLQRYRASCVHNRIAFQVQAISQYGDTKLKSDRDQIFITTYNLPQSVGGHLNDDVNIHSLVTPRPVEGLLVHTPFYQNGLLKVNISWSLPLGKRDFLHLVDTFTCIFPSLIDSC